MKLKELYARVGMSPVPTASVVKPLEQKKTKVATLVAERIKDDAHYTVYTSETEFTTEGRWYKTKAEIDQLSRVLDKTHVPASRLMERHGLHADYRKARQESRYMS